MKLVYAALSFLVHLSVAQAFTAPAFTSNVYDTSQTLSANDLRVLHQTIQNLRDQDDIWAAVAMIPTLEGESIEKAANDTFEKWALGEKGKDHGLLIFVALNDHKMRIEVGRGLEGTITDLAGHRIVDEILKPHFRQDDFANGLKEALLEIARVHRREKDPEEIKSVVDRPVFNWIWASIGFAFNLSGLFLFFAYFIFKKTRGLRVHYRQLPRDISGALALNLGVAIFMSFFWGIAGDEPNFFPLFPIFDSVFVVLCSVPILWQPIQFLRSKKRIEASNQLWDLAAMEKETYLAKLEAARRDSPEKALHFIYTNRIPVNPNQRIRPSPEEVAEEKRLWKNAREIAGWRRFFGRLEIDGTVIYFWQGGGSGGGSWGGGSSGSSSSGSSSSGSSSSSSRGGGTSNGGGASGSW